MMTTMGNDNNITLRPIGILLCSCCIPRSTHYIQNVCRIRIRTNDRHQHTKHQPTHVERVCVCVCMNENCANRPPNKIQHKRERNAMVATHRRTLTYECRQYIYIFLFFSFVSLFVSSVHQSGVNISFNRKSIFVLLNCEFRYSSLLI